MSVERIVSFLPSATELIYELGLEDKLFGVTHECLYPDDAKKKLRVIRSVFDSSFMSSKEIDQKTSELLRTEKDIFKLDYSNLKKANPDLIISQNTCEVCAAHSNQVHQAMRILDNKPILYSMDPHNFQEILESITSLAKLIGRDYEGKKLRQSLQKRINFIQKQNYEIRPRVLAVEWVEPLFTAGHWIPEMVKISGGENLLSRTGEHSRWLDIKEIFQSEPDIIIIMPCGFGMKRTEFEYKKYLRSNENWIQLKAVKNNKIFAVDANSYFSKPSLRTITGLEIMAKIIHPNIFSDLEVPEETFSQLL